MENQSIFDNSSERSLEAFGLLQAEVLQLRKQAQQLQEQLTLTQAREHAAQARSTELAKANDALRRSLDALARDADLDRFVSNALVVVAEQLKAPVAEFWSTSANIAYLELAYWQGSVLTRAQMMDDPRTQGVEIPAEMVADEALPQRQRHYVVEDLPTDPIHVQTFSPMLDLEAWCHKHGVRRMCNIPLRIGNQTIGALVIYLPQDRHLTDQNVELGYALAQQLTLAIQLTRLAEEAKRAAIACEREHAAQERATELAKANESLQRSLNQLASDRNLEAFLSRILQEAIRVLQGASAQIFLYDPIAHTLHPDLGVDETGRTVQPPGIVGIDSPFSQPISADITPGWSRMLSRRRPIHFPPDDPAPWLGASDWHRSRGYSGAVCVAMVIGDEPLGFLGLVVRDRHEFTESEFTFFQTLAQQATLAIQLARLAEETEQTAVIREQEKATQARATELVRANQLLKQSIDRLINTAELEEFAGSILLEITHLVQGCNAGLFLYDQPFHLMRLYMVVNEGQVLRATDHRNQGFELFQQPIPAEKTQAWAMLVQNQKPSIVVLDREPERACWEETIAWHRQKGHQSTICFPLKLANEPWGFLGLAFRYIPTLSEEYLELMQTLVHQLTLALQLARIAQDNQQTAIVEERNRLARDIHDTLAQSFTSILVRLQTANLSLADNPLEAQHHLKLASTLARNGLLEARRSVYELRPLPLENGDLVSALTEYLHTMTDRTPICSRFHQQGALDIIPAYIEVELFRIAQEAITNACKHAHATTLAVELTYFDDRLRLSVQDNGRGFLLPNPQDPRGFGLLSMQERTHRIGGRLTIHTYLGEGTQILVDVELRESSRGIEKIENSD